MKLAFIYSQGSIQKSVDTLREVVTEKYTGNKIKLPEKSEMSESHFEELKSSLSFGPKEKLVQEMEENKEALKRLEEYANQENIQLEKEYTCFITHYGTAGYFHTPDMIFLNIEEKTPGTFLETALHELLHLVFYDKTKEMNHAQTEQFIDQKFLELWEEQFPNYYVQFKDE